jgi:hypothetical protein
MPPPPRLIEFVAEKLGHAWVKSAVHGGGCGFSLRPRADRRGVREFVPNGGEVDAGPASPVRRARTKRRPWDARLGDSVQRAQRKSIGKKKTLTCGTHSTARYAARTPVMTAGPPSQWQWGCARGSEVGPRWVKVLLGRAQVNPAQVSMAACLVLFLLFICFRFPSFFTFISNLYFKFKFLSVVRFKFR